MASLQWGFLGWGRVDPMVSPMWYLKASFPSISISHTGLQFFLGGGGGGRNVFLAIRRGFETFILHINVYVKEIAFNICEGKSMQKERLDSLKSNPFLNVLRLNLEPSSNDLWSITLKFSPSSNCFKLTLPSFVRTELIPLKEVSLFLNTREYILQYLLNHTFFVWQDSP